MLLLLLLLLLLGAALRRSSVASCCSLGRLLGLLLLRGCCFVGAGNRAEPIEMKCGKQMMK
jgi:hypothetical protein